MYGSNHLILGRVSKIGLEKARLQKVETFKIHLSGFLSYEFSFGKRQPGSWNSQKSALLLLFVGGLPCKIKWPKIHSSVEHGATPVISSGLSDHQRVCPDAPAHKALLRIMDFWRNVGSSKPLDIWEWLYWDISHVSPHFLKQPEKNHWMSARSSSECVFPWLFIDVLCPLVDEYLPLNQPRIIFNNSNPCQELYDQLPVPSTQEITIVEKHQPTETIDNMYRQHMLTQRYNKTVVMLLKNAIEIELSNQV